MRNPLLLAAVVTLAPCTAVGFWRAPDVTSASQRGDAVAEITAYLKAGIDGFFTDDPAAGRAAVTAFTKK